MLKSVQVRLQDIQNGPMKEKEYERALLLLDDLFWDMREHFLACWTSSGEDIGMFRTVEWEAYFSVTAQLFLCLTECFAANHQFDACFATAVTAVNLSDSETVKLQAAAILAPFYEADNKIRAFKPLDELLGVSWPQRECAVYFYERIQEPLWTFG